MSYPKQTSKPSPSMTVAFFLYAVIPFISFVGLKLLEVDYGVNLSNYAMFLSASEHTKTTSSTNTKIPKSRRKQSKQQKINIDESTNDRRNKVEKPQKGYKNDKTKKDKAKQQKQEENEGNEKEQSLYTEVSPYHKKLKMHNV